MTFCRRVFARALQQAIDLATLHKLLSQVVEVETHAEISVRLFPFFLKLC